METKRKLTYVKPKIKVVATEVKCPLSTAELPLGEDSTGGDIDSKAWNDRGKTVEYVCWEMSGEDGHISPTQSLQPEET